VAKRVEKKERIKRKKFIGQGDRGKQISKEYGSWTPQKEEKSTNGFFGAPHKK
jgi:hypothetical protein